MSPLFVVCVLCDQWILPYHRRVFKQSATEQRRAFCVVAAKTWNSLSSEVTSSAMLPTFKLKLKTYFFHFHFPARNISPIFPVLLYSVCKCFCIRLRKIFYVCFVWFWKRLYWLAGKCAKYVYANKSDDSNNEHERKTQQNWTLNCPEVDIGSIHSHSTNNTYQHSKCLFSVSVWILCLLQCH